MKKTILLLFLLCAIGVNAQCWKALSLGADYCIALKDEGTLWAWGQNGSGQLGIGSSDNMNLPVKIGTASDWQSISSGYGFVIALKTNGTLWVWGRNDFGLGIASGNSSTVPLQVGGDSDWKFICAGGAHAFAIKNNGTLWAWGRNDFGQLGNGSFANANVPVQVGNDNDWKTVTAGTFHSLAIKTDNTLWSWGYNFHGQLGLGTAGFGTEVNVPTPITAISANHWKSIASGGRHSMAVTEQGTLWVWGNNNFSALGINDGSTYKPIPTPVNNATDWKLAAAGINNSFALKENNTLWTWGENTDGQLGDNSTLNRATPVQIGTNTDWVFVDAGLQHSAFLKAGDILTSGGNNYGELGIGSFVSHTTPQYVNCPGLGINENNKMSLRIYPNPTKGLLSLTAENIRVDEVQVLDNMGRIVLTPVKDITAINVEQLPSGLYLLQVFSGKKSFHLKFVKA